MADTIGSRHEVRDPLVVDQIVAWTGHRAGHAPTLRIALVQRARSGKSQHLDDQVVKRGAASEPCQIEHAHFVFEERVFVICAAGRRLWQHGNRAAVERHDVGRVPHTTGLGIRRRSDLNGFTRAPNGAALFRDYVFDLGACGNIDEGSVPGLQLEYVPTQFAVLRASGELLTSF